MATYGSNPIFRRVNRNTLFADIAAAVGASTTFNAGDFLTFNLTTQTFGTLVGESDSAQFAGVAVESITNGKMVSAYTSDVDSSLGYASVAGPEFGDEVFATLKAGDAVVPGSQLYYNTGATPKNGVTVTAGTKSIGMYFGPALTGAPTTGTVIPIKLGCRVVPSGLLIG
jgi:hypothetical protein